jgi:hypothetical protein
MFDLPVTPTSKRYRISPTVLLEQKNVGVAFRISLLSYIEAEILRHFICTSGNSDL